MLRREASRGKTETKLKDRLHGRANRRKRTSARWKEEKIAMKNGVEIFKSRSPFHWFRRGRIAFYVFLVGSRTSARKLSIVDVTGQEKSRTSYFTRIVVTKRISCYAESQSSTLFDSLRRLRPRNVAQMRRSISTIRKLRLIEKLQATLDEPLRYAGVGDFPRHFSPVVVRDEGIRRRSRVRGVSS